jgi:hypothetical protein
MLGVIGLGVLSLIVQLFFLVLYRKHKVRLRVLVFLRVMSRLHRRAVLL